MHSIQGKLFAVFGVIVLVGVLAVAVNVFNVTGGEMASAELMRREQRLAEAYTAQDYLQGLELGEWSAVLYMVSDRPAGGEMQFIDQRQNYADRLDRYLRNAQLEAETGPERDALYALSQTKQDHDQTFYLFLEAAQAGDVDGAMYQIDVAIEELQAMYDQLQDIIAENETALAEVESRTALYEGIAIGVSVVALVVFVVLTVVAAVVVTRQVNRPVLQLKESTESVLDGRFEPAGLAKLTGRPDEMGQLARAYVRMAAAVGQREADLRAQAAELRARIEQQAGRQSP